jgi:predicted lipoprotein with Yx(FWY)xxD motif
MGLLLLLMILLAGCRPQAVPTASVSGTAVLVPQTGSTSTAPIEITAEPLKPAVSAADQEIQAGGIVVDAIVSPEQGWLVIYSQEGGGLGRVLGYAQVMPGATRNLTVKLKEYQALASGVIYAVLQRDAGETGVFEFPGPDTPAVFDGKTIWTQFRIAAGPVGAAQAASTESVTAAATEPAQPVSTENATAAATPSPLPLTETPTAAPASTTITTTEGTPSVIIADQAIRGGSVKADSVSIQSPSFLTIRNQNINGSYGTVIGWTAVTPGVSENVLVNIDVSRATKTLYAVIHSDTDPVGSFNYPGPDQAVKAQDQVVAQPFNVMDGLLGTNITIQSTGGDSPYLVDSQGMSIYSSLQDKPGVSSCTGECRMSWLPVLAMGRLLPGEGVTVKKFGIIVYRNGNRQVTYAGLPLYYYVGDQKPGDTLGQGVNEVWFLAAP